MKDSEKIKSCITNCFRIFWQLRENSNLYDEPFPQEVLDDFDWKMENLSRALRFACGENVAFDTEVIKRVVKEFIKTSFSPPEQTELIRELWNLCARRVMIPIPKVSKRDGKRITALLFVKQHLPEIKSLLKRTMSNKKQTLVEFARKHGFEFDGTHLLRTLNEVNLPKKRGANRGAK